MSLMQSASLLIGEFGVRRLVWRQFAELCDVFLNFGEFVFEAADLIVEATATPAEMVITRLMGS